MPSISRWISLLLIGVFFTIETVRADETLFFATASIAGKSEIKIDAKLQREISKAKLDPRRGTVVMRLRVQEPFGGGYGQHFTIYPGPPNLALRCSAQFPKLKAGEKETEAGKKPMQAKVAIILDHLPDGNPLDRIEATTAIHPGEDLHVAWTWSGTKHTVFLNGKLATTRVANSPFPREIRPAILLLHDLSLKDRDAAPVSEIAAYDFSFSESEAARDYAEKDDQPFRPREDHGPSMVAEWAPGERKVHIAVDAGNAWACKAARAAVIVKRDGEHLTDGKIELGPDGFAESIFLLPSMTPGKYIAELVLQDRAGRDLAKSATDSWQLPNTPWLGNKLGISDKIQSPWQPIARDASTLKVWGRNYELGGGFGLPQQIFSQGQKLLARPVELEVVRGGRSLPLKNTTVKITEHHPHVATWTGRCETDDLNVRIDGRLEYDGMMVLTVNLKPSVAGQTVKLDGLKLHTVLPKERALFLNTATDQGYWWYSYKSWLPDETGGPLSGRPNQIPNLKAKENEPAKSGVIFDNKKQKPGKSPFLFFVLLCDHDVGLEWFADSLGGWQVDERRTLQEIIREGNGDVRLTCHLANRSFELTHPITLTFGYDATPVKPLPKDWRSAYVHHHALKDVPSDFALWWLWDGPWSKSRPNIFSLQPDDPKQFAKTVGKVPGIKLAPFTNQHVLVPSGPDRQRPDGGWPWLNGLLKSETNNDGWNAVPTSGARDYWAWNIDQWVKAGGMDAIYIDEANTATVSARLLTGSGYIRPDGTHGFGQNTLAMREQIKRTRQVLIDNGKRPIVWIPTYGMMIPHAHAFVDVVSEGESFMFEKPGGQDWIDVWGNGLLERRGGPGAKGGPWLLTLGPAQKFGFVPIFLNYIKFYNDPKYLPALRAQYGLLGLLDIIPLESSGGWFFRAKHDFGVASPETTFHRFFEQSAISSERADVAISYYQRKQSLLLVVTNLGKDVYGGTVKLDRKALGLHPGMLAANSLDGLLPGKNDTSLKIVPLRFDPDGSTLRVHVPAHDFLLIKIEHAKPR